MTGGETGISILHFNISVSVSLSSFAGAIDVNQVK